MTWAQRYAGLLIAVYIYVLLLGVRLTIPLSDLTRVVEEFSAIGMSDYNLREPLYWATGKVLTASFNDAWLAIFVLDMASLVMVAIAVRGRSLSGIAIVCLVLSPMILLGICNIHRQLVGFAAWMLVERLTENSKPSRAVPLHMIPFLIHSSMGILSFVYFFVQACSRKNYPVIFALASFVLLAALLFGNVLAELFRQGTETNTSVIIYLGWAIAVYAILAAATGLRNSMSFFYVLGILVAIALFIFSGGSSGSRFFMLVITVTSIWLFGHQALRSGTPRAKLLNLLLGMALVLPTFGSDFSTDIIRAAYFGVPFGATY
ncbi:hypothetical protein [Sphingorhabdus sp.]|uniref:hypothetical protein n=1 Tax=Sphingorhabdus sp. TaxID=1902408 RepID=UPI00359399AF